MIVIVIFALKYSRFNAVYHGGTENAVATITFADVGVVPASASAFEEADTMYELLSNEELEEYFKLQEEKRNEKAE